MTYERLFPILHETAAIAFADLATLLSTRHSLSEHFQRWDRLFQRWAIHLFARSFMDRIGSFVSWLTTRMLFSCCAFGMELEGHLRSPRPNHAMQLTGSARHGLCYRPADPPAQAAPHSACS